MNNLIEKLKDDEFTRFISKIISALVLLITLMIGIGLIAFGFNLEDGDISNTGISVILIAIPMEILIIKLSFYDYKIVFEKDEK